uniref:GAR domain-containing protein n=1 Tax=Parastrongyloides trichosuri TaxID=131310 RepID=A0A0N4ZFW6_PARTI
MLNQKDSFEVVGASKFFTKIRSIEKYLNIMNIDIVNTRKLQEHNLIQVLTLMKEDMILYRKHLKELKEIHKDTINSIHEKDTEIVNKQFRKIQELFSSTFVTITSHLKEVTNKVYAKESDLDRTIDSFLRWYKSSDFDNETNSLPSISVEELPSIIKQFKKNNEDTLNQTLYLCDYIFKNTIDKLEKEGKDSIEIEVKRKLVDEIRTLAVNREQKVGGFIKIWKEGLKDCEKITSLSKELNEWMKYVEKTDKHVDVCDSLTVEGNEKINNFLENLEIDKKKIMLEEFSSLIDKVSKISKKDDAEKMLNFRHETSSRFSAVLKFIDSIKIFIKKATEEMNELEAKNRIKKGNKRSSEIENIVPNEREKNHEINTAFSGGSPTYSVSEHSDDVKIESSYSRSSSDNHIRTSRIPKYNPSLFKETPSPITVQTSSPTDIRPPFRNYVTSSEKPFNHNSINDLENIDKQINDQLEKCTCANKFIVKKISDHSNAILYEFGSPNPVKKHVKILNSTAIVRVGGGWESLENVFVKTDPCRAPKLRPNPFSSSPVLTRQRSSEYTFDKSFIPPSMPLKEQLKNLETPLRRPTKKSIGIH